MDGLRATVALLLLCASSIAQSTGAKNLIILTTVSPPYVVQAANGTLSGLVVDLLAALAVVDSSIQYDLKLQADGIVGAQPLADGSFNGMIGELVAGRADVVAYRLNVNSATDAVIDYITPFNVEITGVLTRLSPVSGPVQYFVRKGSPTEAYLRRFASEAPRLNEILTNIDAGNNFVATSDEGVTKVLSTTANNVFVEDRNNVSNQLKAHPEISFTSEVLQIAFGAFAVQTDSPLREKFNLATTKVTEQGVLQGLYEKYGLA